MPQVPSRGTPIDLDYIILMATEINDLKRELSGNEFSMSQIGPTSLYKTYGDVVFYANSANVVASSNVTTGVTRTVSFDFSHVKFAKTPIVTASVVNVNDASASDNVIATLRSVGPNSATVKLLFQGTGSFNVSVNVIAIGASTATPTSSI